MSPYRQKMLFAAVGMSVMILGFILLWIMVTLIGLSAWVAYAIQAVVSVELNFVGNWLLTYRDRRQSNQFWRSFGLFHLSRLVTIPFNQLLFNLQVSWVGMPYLIAHVICIGATTVLNYFAGDKLVFGGKLVQKRPEVGNASSPIKPRQLLFVSIVIPVKGGSVKATLSALARQVYASRLFEVIVVGDIDDPALAEARSLPVPFQLHTLEAEVETPGRDSNAKRALGLQKANGQILVVLDSDVLPPRDWLLRIVELLTQEGHYAVAGPLSGLGDGFWDRYIDGNALGSKTPRMASAYTINRSNTHKYKLPVTANFACVREVINTVGYPDPCFTNSYEDYSWFSSMVQAGFGIYCDPLLRTPRHHRSGFKALLNEYKRSGKGCADFIVVHRTSRFAIKRLIQLSLTVLSLFVLLAAVILQPWVLALSALILPLMVASAVKVRHFDGLLYPLISLIFAARFLQGVVSRFIRLGWQPPVESRVIRHIYLPTIPTR